MSVRAMPTLRTWKRRAIKWAEETNGHSLTPFSRATHGTGERFSFAVCGCGCIAVAYDTPEVSGIRGTALHNQHPSRLLHVVS